MVNERSKPRVYSKIVSRSAADKPDYICDGTDDNVQIQAAIDAVATAGGGTVFIKKGTYVIGAGIFTDVGQDNVHIIGEGMGATILQAKAALPTSNAILSLNESYCSVRNLTIDGNKTNQTTQNHIGLGLNHFYNSSITDISAIEVEIKNINRNASNGMGIYGGDGSNFTISNCYVHDCEGIGVYMEDVDYAFVADTRSKSNTLQGFNLSGGTNNKFSNCVALSNTLDGFTNGGSTRHEYLDCYAASNGDNGFEISSGNTKVVGCVSYANTGHGITFAGSSCVLSGCRITDNVKNGLFVSTGNISITGNVFLNNKKHGIEISGGDNNVVTGNSIRVFEGLDTDNTYSGILLTGTAERNVISGNRLQCGDGGTSDYAYGIREAAAADNRNLVVGNIVTDAQTAQISTQGANTVSADNITA